MVCEKKNAAAHSMMFLEDSVSNGYEGEGGM